jgi:hypothetical protein
LRIKPKLDRTVGAGDPDGRFSEISASSASERSIERVRILHHGPLHFRKPNETSNALNLDEFSKIDKLGAVVVASVLDSENALLPPQFAITNLSPTF